MPEWNGHCQRCGREAFGYTMSWFNQELICIGEPDSCDAAEHRHPDLAKAIEAEEQSLQRGERNFPGIGLPPALRLDAFLRWVRRMREGHPDRLPIIEAEELPYCEECGISHEPEDAAIIHATLRDQGDQLEP